MIGYFTGQEERGYDRHDRQVNNRHVAEIFTPAVFNKLLGLHLAISKNPCLSSISSLLQKCFRQLVEVNSFPDNISKLLDIIDQSNRELNKLANNKLYSLQSFDFEPVDEPMVIQVPVEENKQPE